MEVSGSDRAEMDSAQLGRIVNNPKDIKTKALDITDKRKINKTGRLETAATQAKPASAG